MRRHYVVVYEHIKHFGIKLGFQQFYHKWTVNELAIFFFRLLNSILMEATTSAFCISKRRFSCLLEDLIMNSRKLEAGFQNVWHTDTDYA